MLRTRFIVSKGSCTPRDMFALHAARVTSAVSLRTHSYQLASHQKVPHSELLLSGKFTRVSISYLHQLHQTFQGLETHESQPFRTTQLGANLDLTSRMNSHDIYDHGDHLLHALGTFAKPRQEIPPNSIQWSTPLTLIANPSVLDVTINTKACSCISSLSTYARELQTHRCCSGLSKQRQNIVTRVQQAVVDESP